MKIQRTNNKLIVELEFFDWNNGSGQRINQAIKSLPKEDQQNEELKQAMRHYDHTVNIRWVMSHLNAAKKYLGDNEATGGSDWQKYMHPRYQRRIFFPELWTETELEGWGITNIDTY